MAAAAASTATGDAKSGHRTMTVSVPDSVLDAFAPLKGIFVKQNVDVLEMLTGWEQRNRYNIFAWVPPTEEDPSVESLRAGIVGDHALALAEEESGDTCHRQMCGSARRWNMTTRLLLPAGVPARGDEPRLRFTKPFKCTCLCLAPPVVFVWWGDHVIAEVVSPWVCCEWHFKVGPPTHFEDRTKVHPEVHDSDDGYWYTVSSPVCTMPLACPCCYSQAKFKITDIASGAEVGSIGRIWPGCGTSMTNANHFGLTFPEAALPMQKASLLACTMLLDLFTSEDIYHNARRRRSA